MSESKEFRFRVPATFEVVVRGELSVAAAAGFAANLLLSYRMDPTRTTYSKDLPSGGSAELMLGYLPDEVQPQAAVDEELPRIDLHSVISMECRVEGGSRASQLQQAAHILQVLEAMPCDLALVVNGPFPAGDTTVTFDVTTDLDRLFRLQDATRCWPEDQFIAQLAGALISDFAIYDIAPNRDRVETILRGLYIQHRADKPLSTVEV